MIMMMMIMMMIMMMMMIHVVVLDALWFPRIRLPFFGRKDRSNTTSSIELSYNQYNGLKNLGNTCYINSILQGLYHIPIFRDTILSTTFINHSIGHSLQLIFQNLLDCNGYTIDPNVLISRLGIDTRVQEDAQEFLLKLINTLGESIENSNNKNIKDNEIVNSILNGELINIIRCLNVEFRKERKQKFIDLSVDIDGYNTLDETLHHLFEPIIFEKDNQYKAGDYGLQDAIKSSSITSCPKVLVIHLKRFAFDMDTGNMRKINNKLDFPFLLNMTNYMENASNILTQNDNSKVAIDDNDSNRISSRNDKNIYELKTVIVHEGNVNYGHYTCYAKVNDFKSKTKEKWIYLNDHSVIDVDENHVIHNTYGGSSSASSSLSSSLSGFSKNAYILFYQKV